MKELIIVLIIAIIAVVGMYNSTTPTGAAFCPVGQLAHFAFTEAGVPYHSCMVVKAVVLAERKPYQTFGATIIAGGSKQEVVKVYPGRQTYPWENLTFGFKMTGNARFRG